MALIDRIPDAQKMYRSDAYYSAVEAYEEEGEYVPPYDWMLGTVSEEDWRQGILDARAFSTNP